MCKTGINVYGTSTIQRKELYTSQLGLSWGGRPPLVPLDKLFQLQLNTLSMAAQ